MESDPANVADLLMSAPSEKALIACRLLPKALAVEVFDHLEGTHQNKILESFSDQAARAFLEENAAG